ncbi:DUF7740 domain-containing protein [Raoultella ornithinolytica]|uniref:DUF7740 domain-containing protein n=1 Tax=Raoultella ornithinolytica TaxID=54291 RepID=UPI000CF35B92|nr:hypothetical protein [Raoultella ornithinolytica]PQH12718.1 hypothetical protein C5T92_22315 [Raoultella ornithinolytica]PQH34826.1 hypothetical protein C5T94_24030 [Raoultella ornithinolytica]
MSTKHQIQELKQRIDPAVLEAAADEYADMLITLCLCMKMAGPTRANIGACVIALKKRLVTCHSQNAINEILTSWDPVGAFLSLRREANEAAASHGDQTDVFV